MERNFKFPCWRKKVDKSLLFERGGMTTIPTLFHKLWELDEIIGKATEQDDERTHVIVKFSRKVRTKYREDFGESLPVELTGRITFLDREKSPAYRLFLNHKDEKSGRTVIDYLRPLYVMSFFRELNLEMEQYAFLEDKGVNREGRTLTKIRKDLKDSTKNTDAKILKELKEIGKNKRKTNLFSEFLDIEFDKDKRTIFLAPEHIIKPPFPHLFKKFVGSPSLKKMVDSFEGAQNPHIFPMDEWRKRELMHQETGDKNIIYLLIDTKSKRFYVGETGQTFGQRLKDSSYEEKIKDWNYYKIIVLQDSIGKRERKTIEKALIHSFASVLEEDKKPEKVPLIEGADFSDYKLVNSKDFS